MLSSIDTLYQLYTLGFSVRRLLWNIPHGGIHEDHDALCAFSCREIPAALHCRGTRLFFLRAILSVWSAISHQHAGDRAGDVKPKALLCPWSAAGGLAAAADL